MTTDERLMPAAATERVAAAERAASGMVDWVKDQHAPTMRIYDAVDGTWTKPLDTFWVQALYLRMVVNKCSACTFASPVEGHVGPHVAQAREQALAHRDARVIYDERGEHCSVCPVSARMKPGRVRAHIERVREMGRLHAGPVQEITMHRYRLEPSVPLRTAATPIAERQNGMHGPHGTGVAGSGRRRRRHRRGRRRE